MKLDIERVIEAAGGIDRAFIRTPQYRSEALSRLLGMNVILKVETANPVGSVAGRAVEWWMSSPRASAAAGQA